MDNICVHIHSFIIKPETQQWHIMINQTTLSVSYWPTLKPSLLALVVEVALFQPVSLQGR